MGGTAGEDETNNDDHRDGNDTDHNRDNDVSDDDQSSTTTSSMGTITWIIETPPPGLPALVEGAAEAMEASGAPSSTSSSSTPPPPPSVSWLDDPSRMTLSIDEIEDAIEIKEQIERMDDIENLSDYNYVQLALLVGDDLGGGISRARRMQAFRREYGIVVGTEEEGRRYLDELIRLAPTYFLNFSFQSTVNTCEAVFWEGGFRPKQVLTTPEKVQSWMVGHYYMYHCFCPDFETIREGISMHIDCHSYDSTKNMSVTDFRQLWDQLLVAYPYKIHTKKHYYTGVSWNLTYSVVNKVCPSEWIPKYQVGCSTPGGCSLDEIYLQPTLSIANQRLLMSWKDSLQRRYRNERTFSLAAMASLLPPKDEDEPSLSDFKDIMQGGYQPSLTTDDEDFEAIQ